MEGMNLRGALYLARMLIESLAAAADADMDATTIDINIVKSDGSIETVASVTGTTIMQKIDSALEE